MPTPGQTLTQRILAAAPDIRVDEVVCARATQALPAAVEKSFRAMTIVWMPNRVWGLSFQLGDREVRLGHRQGDHVASHPELYNFPTDWAHEALRINVEGSLLHELGHACLDAALARSGVDERTVYRDLELVRVVDGPVSTYNGHDLPGAPGERPMSPNDRLHEMFAEAFRWWCVNPSAFAQRWPNWNASVQWAILQLQPARKSKNA